MAEEDQEEKLAKLLNELAEKRSKDGGVRVAHHEGQRAACHAQLHRVPLVHATSVKAAHEIVHSREIKTRTALARTPSETERYLGITDVVYTSAGVVYPDHEIAFVFSPEAEHGVDVEATPWDTGYLRSRPNLPRPPDPTRREIYLAHCLRAPEYRTYLVEYVASCFHCADDYLLGADPYFDDPAGLMTPGPERARSRSFEVRFKGNLRLNDWKLLHVFMDKGATNGHQVQRLVKEWGVPLTLRRVEDGTLIDQVRSWMVEHLVQERLRLS